MTAKNGLIVALDVKTFAEAERLVGDLGDLVGTFKIGSELFTACGPKVVEAVQKSGAEVFLDLKFHDIPNTVAAAIRSALAMDVFLCNVHASGGRKMMQEAAKAAKSDKKKMNVIAVTVLTSMGADDLKETGVVAKPADQVLALAQLAQDSGMDGVVCSGQEARAIRNQAGKKFLIVTPGVRPVWAATGDQTRVTTPAEAIEAGADFIVVGRPITAAPDPREATKKVLVEL